jgi:putative transposase
MPDIMVCLACLRQYLDWTTLGRLSRVTEALLAMTGRVTMRGLARWAGTGGSYRTTQRFFTTSINGATLQWVLMRHHLLEPDDVIVLGGDDVVVTKAGKHPYGLDRFFFIPLWQSGPWAGFSESLADQCQTPHLLPRHAGTTGEATHLHGS